MSINEMEAKITELQELEKLAEEVKAEMETIRDSIKSEMLSRDTSELTAGRFVVRWTTTLSNRLDTTAMKKAAPELYKAFVRQVTSRRFTISA